MRKIFSEFAKEKERVESRAGFMALKEQQKLEKELTGQHHSTNTKFEMNLHMSGKANIIHQTSRNKNHERGTKTCTRNRWFQSQLV